MREKSIFCLGGKWVWAVGGWTLLHSYSIHLTHWRGLIVRRWTQVTNPNFIQSVHWAIALICRIRSMIPNGSIGSRRWIVNSRYCKFLLRALSPLFHWGTFGLRLKIPVPSGSHYPGSCKGMSSLATSYCLQCAKIDFDFFTKHCLDHARHADPGDFNVELGYHSMDKCVESQLTPVIHRSAPREDSSHSHIDANR